MAGHGCVTCSVCKRGCPICPTCLCGNLRLLVELHRVQFNPTDTEVAEDWWWQNRQVRKPARPDGWGKRLGKWLERGT